MFFDRLQRTAATAATYLLGWAAATFLNLVLVVLLVPGRDVPLPYAAALSTSLSLLGFLCGRLLFSGQGWSRRRVLELLLHESPGRTLLHWLALLLPATWLTLASGELEQHEGGHPLAFLGMGLGTSLLILGGPAAVLTGVTLALISVTLFLRSMAVLPSPVPSDRIVR